MGGGGNRWTRVQFSAMVLLHYNNEALTLIVRPTGIAIASQPDSYYRKGNDSLFVMVFKLSPYLIGIATTYRKTLLVQVMKI